MKLRSIIARTRVAATALLLTLTLGAWADNTKTTVSKVTTTVELSDDVDYIVSDAEPFGADGVVNITNTDHAVLILKSVKPSVTQTLLSAHVQINGARAVNNSNCQVKIYNRGSIILPYGNSVRPLTVYSEPNFGGESTDDFGLESTGGFMNTLTEDKLNNRISSFRLKRGYMVTFANGAGGFGYQRCFIAADSDLEVAVLPSVLQNSISSYRVFKWYDTGKPQLAAAAGDGAACSALNVTSTYTWSAGSDMLPNIEVVPHQIYSGYPSASTCGSVTYSPHMKTSNEPRNSADDHPEDLKAILNNWQSLMRTGMRLCTPSSWDGSDYWNGTGFLAEFLDSIDARGWRCDIIDLHCYWAEGSFGNIHYWVDNFHRPVWISEWCWGASWNNNGAFASGVTENQVRDAVKRICDNLNGMNYVERYYYWNGERDISKLYKGGKLTPAGEMYAGLDGGVGYNGRYDYAPRVPVQKDPGAVSVSFDKNAGTATLTWHEYNGELNEGIFVDRQLPGGSWTELASIAMKENAADYTFVDESAAAGYKYRVRIVDGNGKERLSKAVMAASDVLEPGDQVLLDGEVRYIGGNQLLNGDFDMGFYGWTNGEGGALSESLFQVVPVGGIEEGSYLQAYGNGSIRTAASVKTLVDIQPATDYYVSGASCNSNYSATISFTADGGSTLVTDPLGCAFDNTTAVWNTKFNAFNSGDYSQMVVALRSLGAKAQFDKLLLAQLFDTQEAAIADGVKWGKAKGEALADYLSQAGLYFDITGDLRQRLQAISGTDQTALASVNQLLADAFKAVDMLRQLPQLNSDLPYLCELYNLPVADAMLANTAYTIDDVLALCEKLAADKAELLPLTVVSNAVKSPMFSSTNGWETKVGTYKGGDQRTNDNGEYTFWNAWWSGLSASVGTAQTMEIRQQVENLDHGLYAVRCLATTEHFCLSDQHAYITNGKLTANSHNLTANYFDLPTVSTADRWEELTSLPVYVDDGGTVTIGFTGSKQGATDNKWTKIGDTGSTGDKREGWWCATGFELMHAPLYRPTDVTVGQWNVICLPYAFTPSYGLSIYQIVGITSDLHNLCLEPLQSVEAGMPCIYRADEADVLFYEKGERTNAEKVGPGNLEGYFERSGRVKVGEYMVQDGQWVRQETRSNYLPKYSATITTAVGLPVLSDWTGATMPIVGAAEELGNSIQSATATGSMVDDGIYSLDGRSLKGHSLKHGIYIKVTDGVATKISR